MKAMVKVRRYLTDERHNRPSSRVVVDFDEVETTDRYLVLTEAGGYLRVGMERIDFDWPDLLVLATAIAKASPKTPTSLG